MPQADEETPEALERLRKVIADYERAMYLSSFESEMVRNLKWVANYIASIFELEQPYPTKEVE